LIYDAAYDFDETTDFSRLKRYAWLPLPVTDEIDPLNAKRVKSQVDTRLAARGLMETTQHPDFLIDPLVDSIKKIDTTGGPEEYGIFREGRLRLAFVTPDTRQVFWYSEVRVRLKSGLLPPEKDRLIGDAVDELLRNYPPPPKM
jgi:hypothetical protein